MTGFIVSRGIMSLFQKFRYVYYLVQVMSNGILKSARHSAVVNDSESRLSMVLASFPGKSLRIHPAPELVDEGHPLMYKTFTWGEYLVSKANNSTDALAELRLNSQPKT